MIRVLVVDDHPLFREGVINALSAESDCEVVADVGTVSAALQAARQLKPDLVLTDIRLDAGGNGIELARAIRQEQPKTKIVVLTNYSNEPYIRAMMELGVEAYLVKTTPPKEVIESVRMVMDGQTVFSKSVAQVLRRSYLGGMSNGLADAPEGITDREKSVLELLATGASNTEMAEMLHVSDSTVRFHLTNIYGKLGVKNRTEAIRRAALQGLIVLDE